MKTRAAKTANRRGAYALVMVMVFGGISFLILAMAMDWTTSSAKLNDRNNQYFASVAAAEAATEKVLTQMSADFQKQGPSYLPLRLPTYRSTVPTGSDNSYWSQFAFSDGAGNGDSTRVEQASPWAVSPLVSQYAGLSGYAAIYQIVSNAREVGARHQITAAVLQEVQPAVIPIFQFAIFYNMDLEINPGPNMTVKGRVHSNGHIYAEPQSSLTFLGDVTAADDIIHDKMPGDPLIRAPGTITYKGEHDSGVNTLNLPIGSDNSPDSVRQIVEIPPAAESPGSALGQQRFYNKADLIVLVRDGGVEARSGALAPVAAPVVVNWSGAGGISSFVRTNVSFYNKREGKMIKATEIDVGQLKTWNTAGNPLKTALGRDVESIYVADLRSQSGTTEPGIRLVNGQSLPSRGLTVSTPDPLYVRGHYNAPNPGTGNTSNTKPAALIADAINILSVNWNDANAASALSSRAAGATTVNAAFLAGIVPTGNGFYSGGVENFPRFLEDWSGRAFTYNGSMIVMFPSKFAIAPWKGTGSTVGVYNPPTRNWNFDTAFLDPNRLPPGTPSARTVIRGQWQTVAPDS